MSLSMYRTPPDETLKNFRTSTDDHLILVIRGWARNNYGSTTGAWDNMTQCALHVLGERAVHEPALHKDAKVLVDEYLKFAGPYAGFGAAWNKFGLEIGQFAALLVDKHQAIFTNADIAAHKPQTSLILPRPSPSSFGSEFCEHN